MALREAQLCAEVRQAVFVKLFCLKEISNLNNLTSSHTSHNLLSRVVLLARKCAYRNRRTRNAAALTCVSGAYEVRMHVEKTEESEGSSSHLLEWNEPVLKVMRPRN